MWRYSTDKKYSYFDTEYIKDLLTNDNLNKDLGFLHVTGFYQKF
jgi:hypothetical protein